MKRAKGQQIHHAGDTDLTSLSGGMRSEDVCEYCIYLIKQFHRQILHLLGLESVRERLPLKSNFEYNRGIVELMPKVQSDLEQNPWIKCLNMR